MKPDETDTAVHIEWHDGQIPAFAEEVLDTLYGSLYSSLPQLALGDLHHASTYVARTDERVQALFLYALDGAAARVINESMAIDGRDAHRFADALFHRFPGVMRVDFHAVACTGVPASRPARRFLLDEDIVIDLPASEADYLASLGKATRKALRQHAARADGLVHRVLAGYDVHAELVQRIVAFNHARLAAKRRHSALDPNAVRQLLKLLRARGLVGVLEMSGRLCAGTLACRIGDDIYSLVTAHDPAFNTLGLGNLSRHLMIGAAIRAGARRFHLLGGNFSSKRGCGAKRKALHHLVIYQNRWQMYADLHHRVSLALREQRYRLGIWLDAGTSPVDKRVGSRGRTQVVGTILPKTIVMLGRLLRAIRRIRWRRWRGSEPAA